MSVDVEDYFQVEAFAGLVKRDSWDSFPSRVYANTMRVLDLFDEFDVKATFFFLGWVAERNPRLLKETHQRGHELACHSYWHRTIFSLTPEEFREDTLRSKKLIEDATGVGVKGYRAPSWSITRQSLWALEILAEEGFEYDSSIYPIHHDIYGIPGAKRTPYVHHIGGRILAEFPPATIQMLGGTLPVAGGGYLRLFPLSFTDWAIRRMQAEAGQQVVVYFHPWEVDPEQPRIAAGLRSRFRHYTNLHKMESRLRALMSRHPFQSFRDLLASRSTGAGTAEVAVAQRAAQ